MKKLLRSCIAAATAMVALAFSAGASAADNIISMDLGYCTTGEAAYSDNGVNNETGGLAGIAVRLPKETISQYIGGSITGINTPWVTMGQSPEITFWLRRTPLGENITTQTVKLTGELNPESLFGDMKWSTVKLDNPYVIPEDIDELWFGYDVNVTPLQFYVGTSISNKTVTKGCYFIEYDQKFYFDACDAPLYAHVFLLSATVEVDENAYANRASIESVDYNPIVAEGTPGFALAKVYNRGTNDIYVLNFHYEADGKTYDQDMILNQAIKPATTASVTVPVPALATGDMDVTIDKVNDLANNYSTHHTLQTIAIPADVASQYSRRQAIEYFASEGAYLSPGHFDEILQPMLSQYEGRHTLICHHAGDQFATEGSYSIPDENGEPMPISDEDMLMIQLCGGWTQYVYMPTMALDRTAHVTNTALNTDEVLLSPILYDSPTRDQVLAEFFSTPTFASVHVASEFDPATNTVTATVSGTVAPGVLPEGERLCLAAFLTEDNVWSDSQEFPGDKSEWEQTEYIHQALVRLRLSESIFGDNIPESGEYSMKFSTEVDPDWKLGDMKVKALLTRNIRNTPARNRSVINSNEAYVGSESTAMGEINADTASAPAEIYTLSGLRVTNRTNLTPGIYIMRQGNKSSKIRVN